MQYCTKQKRFHYDVILNNFYADGVISTTAAKSALGVEAVAGILPHDEGIDQAASQGLIHEASDNLPFMKALSATADWLEKGTAVDEAWLTSLLPRRTAGDPEESAYRCARRQECRNWRHYRR